MEGKQNGALEKLEKQIQNQQEERISGIYSNGISDRRIERQNKQENCISKEAVYG